MKKLMFALVAAVAGLSAQAVSVSWSATDIINAAQLNYGEGTEYYVFANGYRLAENAFTADASVSQSAIQSAIAAGTFDMSLLDKAIGHATVNEMGGTADSKTGLTGMTQGVDSVDLFAIIIDSVSKTPDTYAIFAGDKSGVTFDGFSGDAMINLGSLMDTTYSGGEGTPWTAQSVPEPTSGLLLLLGVAGLALRRRRA